MPPVDLVAVLEEALANLDALIEDFVLLAEQTRERVGSPRCDQGTDGGDGREVLADAWLRPLAARSRSLTIRAGGAEGCQPLVNVLNRHSEHEEIRREVLEALDSQRVARFPRPVAA
jgi:hypothetical protein